MRRVTPLALLAALASPAFGDPLQDRVTAIGTMLDARRPQGEALKRSVASHMGSLRDLSRRADRAGMSLPPLVVRGPVMQRLKNRVGFGSPHILVENRVSLLLGDKEVAFRFETREGDGAERWHPVKDQPMKVQKLPRRNADNAVLRMMIEHGIDAEDLDHAFDRWTQMVAFALVPPELRARIQAQMEAQMLPPAPVAQLPAPAATPAAAPAAQ